MFDFNKLSKNISDNNETHKENTKRNIFTISTECSEYDVFHKYINSIRQNLSPRETLCLDDSAPFSLSKECFEIIHARAEHEKLDRYKNDFLCSPMWKQNIDEAIYRINHEIDCQKIEQIYHVEKRHAEYALNMFHLKIRNKSLKNLLRYSSAYEILDECVKEARFVLAVQCLEGESQE